MIPFFKPTIGEEEKKAISDVIDSGWLVMGKKTQEFEEAFADYVGAKYAVFVDSGTAALFLALKWQEMKMGITFYGLPIETPSLTFVSDPEVICNIGAIPRFVDVDPKSFCIEDLNYHSEYLRIAVHLTGNRANAPATVYDSAHRIEKGDVSDSQVPWCYSFYATKNMSTIQGGMIALNDENGYKWLKMARDHGINKGTKERYTEKTSTYSVEFVGFRLKADDVRATIGLEQLKKLPEATRRRNGIRDFYNKAFGLDRRGNHLYPIMVYDREKFFDLMASAEIQCSVHFLPLDQMPAFKPYSPCSHNDGICALPVTHKIGQSLVSLPLFPDMTEEEMNYVAEKVLATNLLINE